MNNIITTLVSYFQYDFVVYAFIVGVLVALCASLLGTTLVLKRFSYLGDGLSHIAFCSVSIATILDVSNDLIIVFPITCLAAIMLLRVGQNTKINGDAAIAMLSVSSLAIGYLLLNIFPASSNISGDVCSTLFGSTSILTLNKTDVYISMALSVVVIFVFVFFYNRIFSVTFDEDFAQATGTNTKLYNLLMAIVISAVVVLSMSLVGSLLIAALIIFPAISSMRLFNNFKSVTISAVVIALLCSSTGILVSILMGTPVGSTIVVMNIIVFLFSTILNKTLKLS